MRSTSETISGVPQPAGMELAERKCRGKFTSANAADRPLSVVNVSAGAACSDAHRALPALDAEILSAEQEWEVSCAEPHVTHETGPSHSPHHRHNSHVTHFPNGAPHHYVCDLSQPTYTQTYTYMHLFIDAAIYL